MHEEKPRLEWRPQASADLLQIVAYIADRDPDAAQRLKELIQAKVEALPDHPKLYAASAWVDGLRQMVVRRSYLVLYRESAQCVEIVSVVHSRRRLPALVSRTVDTDD